jgi:endogenous inhibitor of DNA gyrase (YacG/DUF329 family)
MDEATLKCPKCEGEFKPQRPWQRFCSSKCRNDYNNEANRARAEAKNEREFVSFIDYLKRR